MTTATCGCGTALAAGDCLCPATPLAKLIGRRYSELRSRLGDVSSSTVAARLNDLEESGLIARRVFPETPPRVEYSLTARGRELCGILTDFLRRGRRR